jgi:hypothetical protein
MAYYEQVNAYEWMVRSNLEDESNKLKSIIAASCPICFKAIPIEPPNPDDDNVCQHEVITLSELVTAHGLQSVDFIFEVASINPAIHHV